MEASLDLAKIRAELSTRRWSVEELFRRCVELGFDGNARTIHYIVDGTTASPRLVAAYYVAKALDLELVPGSALRSEG